MTTQTKWIVAAAAAGVCAAAVCLVLWSGGAPVTKGSAQSSPVEPKGGTLDTAALDTSLPEDEQGDLHEVHVTATEPLGEVNGVRILLKDLIPLPPGKDDATHAIPQARLEFLYDRAVERELVFQNARKQGIELTKAQNEALAQAKARRKSSAFGAFDNLQGTSEQDDFEQRDFQALLLQASLAEKHGVPSPHVTPEQVKTYYDEHQDRFGPLPSEPAQRQAAWQRIDREIRSLLAPLLQEAHDVQFELFRQELKQRARIIHSPVITQAVSANR